MLQKLGPYPIEREVGRGGMGVVYLGRDPRLDRPVALKVLPELLAGDAERLARFEREARLLASLNHPNIAGIYGIEEADGRRFLALEYVEGETLAEHLQRSRLGIDETLDVCGQIAAALEAAHEAGIIHRDLKPGNVKLTPAGTVKVLDFGLARGPGAGSEPASDISQSPTLTQMATGAGVILGTAAYMSPEQARGKPVDRRTDIWSFGCVLYECLTGAQAFAGETVSDMIAAILQGEPDASRLPEGLPPRLRELMGRCLEKDPRRRLRDIGDARIELEELRAARSPGSGRAARGVGIPAVEPAPSAPARRGHGRRIAAGVALIAAAAAIGFGAYRLGLARRDATPMRFTLSAPPGRDLDLDPNQLAISPDGRWLAMSVLDSSGQNSLWIRPLGSFEARPLAGTRNATLPFWSPDSRQLGFFADGKLKRVRLAGGNPEIVCDAASGRGASWGIHDVIVFAPEPAGPLRMVRAAGGEPTAVTSPDTAHGETAHRWPSFLPDGEHFTYAALPTRSGGYSCFVGSTRSRQRVPLFSASFAPIYAAPGYLIFSRNEALLAQRFDPRRLKLIGDPFTIGPPPEANTSFSASPCASVSANGVLAWRAAGASDTRLVWVDRAGRETGSVGLAPDRWGNMMLSPDGHRAQVEQRTESGNVDLWIADLDRGTATRLTYGQGRNTIGSWSPDGREILYGSTRDGPRDLYRRAADGSGSDRPFYKSSVPFKDPSAWSPDGRWVLVGQIGGTNNWDVLRFPAAGGPPVPLLDSPFNEQNPSISPDGRWVLYVSDESGSLQAYVQSFPELGHKQQVSKSGALFAMWTAGGREILLFRPDFSLASLAVEGGRELRLDTPRPLFRIPSNAVTCVPAPDGQRFLMTVPAVQTAAAISVAVNWMAGRDE